MHQLCWCDYRSSFEYIFMVSGWLTSHAHRQLVPLAPCGRWRYPARWHRPPGEQTESLPAPVQTHLIHKYMKISVKQLQHDHMSVSHLNRLIECHKSDEMVSECIHGALKSFLAMDLYRYIITCIFFKLVYAEWRTVMGSN